VNFLIRITVFLSLFLPALSFAAQCDGTALIQDPEPFKWTYVATPDPHYVGTMEIAEASLDINGETITTRV
jgi:hypothetical protein